MKKERLFIDDMIKPSVEIPCPSDGLERLKHYLKKYGMTMRTKKGAGDYRTVYYNDPLDLYWLGMNLGMPSFDTGISIHI